MKRPMIEPRLTMAKSDYIVHCGQATCRAPLGFALRPLPEGSRVNIALLAYSRDLGGGPHPNHDWFMQAPWSREQSAAQGFSRRVAGDGTTYYALIKPRPKRDALGQTVLDEHGQFAPRQGGRVPERFDTMTDEERGQGLRGHVLRGEFPALPAIIECGDCQRWNLVPVPEDTAT
jgi:hypothetical protein